MKVRRRIFNIIQIGSKEDFISKAFDFYIVAVIFVNLFCTLFSTFAEAEPYLPVLHIVEFITIIIFTIEYLLRLWTARYLYPEKKPGVALLRFLVSFSGIVDLLTFFPYYLPFFFPGGAVAFRIFRVFRILRLFRINQTYDAFNVITAVLKEKKNQLISSISMIAILMVASSLCLYSLEHNAQPEQFKNAFSGLWWSASTLLTVGYGDIYPITTVGKAFAIVISFLGVGMVAIPTGIISAGFVEQYTKLKYLPGYADGLVKRRGTTDSLETTGSRKTEDALETSGNSKATDVLESSDNLKVEDRGLREMVIAENHPWVDVPVQHIPLEPNVSIVLLLRNSERIIPEATTTIQAGDVVFIYTE